MSRSYEEEMKHLQKLYDELMSDEDIDVADPYADCNTSGVYEPSESESSNDDYKVLPKKAKRLKKPEVNESTQDDQPDQIKPYYHYLTRGNKWYRKLATELLFDSAMVNAYITYKEVTQSKISITDFKRQVAQGLLGDFSDADSINSNAEKIGALSAMQK
ncbi:hypothetical protein HHI36_007496 [Cryptolaemus montrouzieri]|uniref:PiggyBac transposable element-derived protein domain-containing protein n=1 Tax=Cryptolaemus montrouzieri TaxID=559131 RepID=A0ABD2MPU6_9CUCU